MHSPNAEPKFTNITSQFDEELNESSQIDDNTPWTTIEKPSSGFGDDEPWELEDHGEEKMTPIPTTTRFTSPFNDNEYYPIEKISSKNNFFSDSFNPSEDTEQTLTKTVRFDDNIQSIPSPTPPLRDSPESSESDSDGIVIDDITPNFEANNNHMETSYVTIDENDLKERPYESVELSPDTIEELPSSSNKNFHFFSRRNLFKYFLLDISNDNIPVKSTLSPSNIDTQYKINLRPESEITTTTDTNIRSNTDTQVVQPYESGILIFTI